MEQPDQDRINQALGDHFRRARETLGWTLKDVSDRVAKEGGQASTSALSRFERGQTTFTFLDVMALAAALSTPMAYLDELVRSARRPRLELPDSSDFAELLAEGQRLHHIGLYHRALPHFETAYDVALRLETSDRADRIAEAMIWTAETHRRERRFAMCGELVTKILNLPGCSTENTVRALCLDLVTKYMTADFYRARMVANRLKRQMIGMSANVRAFALSVLAELELKQGRLSEAIPVLRNACAAYHEFGETQTIVRSEARLGYCIGMTGDPNTGKLLLNEAYLTSAKQGCLDNAAYALRKLGELEFSIGEHSSARRRFETAADLARRMGDQNALFIAWFHLWKTEQHCPAVPAKAALILTRLLKKVDPRLPEAEAFVAALHEASEAQGGRDVQPRQ